MPMLWIRDGSPFEVIVESDDGEVLNRMEVPGVNGKDAVWRVTDVQDAQPSNPVFDKGFKMRPRERASDEFVLGIEFRTEEKQSEEEGPGTGEAY